MLSFPPAARIPLVRFMTSPSCSANLSGCERESGAPQLGSMPLTIHCPNSGLTSILATVRDADPQVTGLCWTSPVRPRPRWNGTSAGTRPSCAAPVQASTAPRPPLLPRPCVIPDKVCPPGYRAIMSRRGSLLVMGAASALGFALLAWVSSAGSLQLLQAPTTTASPPQRPRRTPQQLLPTTGTTTGAPEPAESQGADLGWVDSLLTVLVMSVALIGMVLLARWVWRNHGLPRRRKHSPPEVPFEVLPEVSLALVDDAPAQFATLEEGSPRNAIVACWLRLEEVAGEAGAPAQPAETSTEFTTRLLGALAFDPAMINGFADLYREARFSRHELGEPARRAAVAALRSLYDDIGASGPPTSSETRPTTDMSDQRAP